MTKRNTDHSLTAGLVALGISTINSIYEFFDWDIKTIQEQKDIYTKEMKDLINSTIPNANELNGGKGIDIVFEEYITNPNNSDKLVNGLYKSRLLPTSIHIDEDVLLIKDYALFIGAHEIEHLRLDVLNTLTNSDYRDYMKNWKTMNANHSVYLDWQKFISDEEIQADVAGREYLFKLHGDFYRVLNFYSPYGTMIWIH